MGGALFHNVSTFEAPSVGRVDKAEKIVKILFGVWCFTRLLVGLIQAILAKNQLSMKKFTPGTLQKTVKVFLGF